MKKLLIAACILCTILCFWFPATYFKTDSDKMEIKVSHILVDSEEEALRIKQEIENKEISFQDAAEKYSSCFSAQNKGDLGYIPKGMLDKKIENYIFETKNYFKISEPIETDFGWHIVLVNGVKYFSDKDNFARRHFLTKDDAMQMDKIK